MILVESRYFLVAVVRSAVAVIVRGHYQQLGAVLRGLRLFRRAVLDLRRHDRQLLIAPSLLEAGRERHCKYKALVCNNQGFPQENTK